MKKVMFAAAVVAGMLAFGDDAIESQNVVGYTQKTIPAGKYMMVAVQFNNVGGIAKTFDQAFKLNVTGPKAWNSADDDDCIPGWYATAPNLKIPLGTVDKAYRELYWTQNAWDDDLGFVEGWADADGVYIATAPMLKGYGVWLVAGDTDMTVTIDGEVLGAASDTISAGTGYNMLKLPFPVALNAGDSKINWNLTGVKAWNSADDDDCIPGWYATAPNLKIPLGTVDKAYRELFYSSNAWDDDLGFVEGWADADGVYVPNAVIPEGMAFWLVVPSAVTATVSR